MRRLTTRAVLVSGLVSEGALTRTLGDVAIEKRGRIGRVGYRTSGDGGTVTEARHFCASSSSMRCRAMPRLSPDALL